MSTIQYTIRNIPPATDRVLRKRAKQTGKSFNKTVVEALNRQLFGTADVPPEEDNFDWLFGAGKDTLGPEFDEAMKEFKKIDKKLWR